MLLDFLADCCCVIPDEEGDFMAVRRALTPACNIYVPSIVFDLWPMYTLQATGAKQCTDPVQEMVYLMPIGAHDFWGKPEFRNLALDFYRNDTFPDNSVTYDFSLEEMILLRYPEGKEELDLEEFGSCNAVYMRLSRDPLITAHVFILLEDPSEGWKNIVEEYDIPVHMLVESAKGLGDWFHSIPLSTYMQNTTKPHLLPKFYFKGKYASGSQLPGASLYMSLPAPGNFGMPEILRTPW